MGGRGLVIVVGAVVGLSVAEREANACTCAPSSNLVAPASDEHPVGAALAFVSWCGSGLDAWTVTVDGVAATLVVGDEASDVATVTVQPAPAEGAEVVLVESCDTELGLADGCVLDQELIERARFVIGPADVESPRRAETVVIGHESGMFEAECGGPSLPFLHVHAEVTLGEHEPGTWAEITFLRDDEPVRSETRELPDTAPLQSSLLVDEDDYAGHEICVEAVVHDAAGNESEAQRECTSIAETNRACTLASDGRPGAVATFLLFLVGCRRRRAATGPTPRLVA